MVFVKSIFVALLAMVTAAILTLMAFVAVLETQAAPVPRGTTIGVDPVSIARSFPALLLVPALGALGGFIWEYRRLCKREIHGRAKP